MAVIRTEAMRKLEDHIVCAIPELEGRVCVGQAPPSKDLSFPSLAIVPSKWRYDPNQAQERGDPSPSTIVVQVGAHSSLVQLQVAAKTSGQRGALEQKIIDLFLETPLTPGVLKTTVTKCANLGNFLAAWELEDDEWDNDGVFGKKYYSIITVLGIIPALVTRGSVHTFQQLQLGFSHELDDTFDESTFNSSAKVEVVQVNSDGTISAVP